MNTIGNNIKITFFGESHGPSIGVVIDNLPAGLEIDQELIKFNLTKRRPVKNINTTRIEADNYEIISGFFNGKTTGAALTVLIENKNTISNDYKNLNITPRPSHSDFPASVKYNNFNDYRGGGFFSGRLTALWIVVGSIAEQILKKQNIIVASHILSIKNIKDDSFDMNIENVKELSSLNAEIFPLINPEKKKEMLDLIADTKRSLDSVGGIVESKAVTIPVELGEPYFLSVESYISNLLFSVPAEKAVAFGSGFEITEMNGSKANDQYLYKDNQVSTSSNHNGGILGGLTNGRPLIVKTALKPTSSIAKTQKTVNLETKENVELSVHGRHDPQIVSRGVHVINAVINFAILDLLLFKINKNELI